MAEHPGLVAAARFGLEPARAPVEVSVAGVDELLRVVRLDRLGGLLHAAIGDGSVVVPEHVVASVRELWHAQLVGAVSAETLAVRTAAVLDDASVEWRLTKGPALAHLDYPNPALRPFGDVDVIVHPDSWETAVSALTTAGYRRELAELAPGFDDRFGKGATITTADGLEVDLHRRLAIGRFGVRLPTEALFVGRSTLDLGGRALPTLDGSGRLMHACYHAALGGFRHLRAHRDIAQLLLVTGVDWEATVALAERHRVVAVVARAVADAWGTLDLRAAHPARTWAVDQRIGWADRRALAVFAAERPFREQAMTAVPVLIGRGAIVYVRALARQPGRSPLRWRDLPGRVRRTLRPRR